MKSYVLTLIAAFCLFSVLYSQTPCDDPCPLPADPGAEWPLDNMMYSFNVNIGNTPVYYNGTCNSTSVRDAWAWFTGTGDSLKIEYSPNDNDAIMHVFDASGGCGSLVEMDCSDKAGYMTEDISFKTDPGVVYLIRIQSTDGSVMTGYLTIYNYGGAPHPCEEAYLPFRGTFEDESTQNHPVNYYETIFTEDRFFETDKAAYFDGFDDYVYMSNGGSFDFTNGITLTAWIKPDTYVDGTII
ncbi:MAG: hypothetical protein ABIJ16_08350, partial [Bacteroidota bacterium]